MTNTALQMLEAEYAKKRAELEAHLTLAAKLPTNGKHVAWVGEDGWDSEGKPKPPITKTTELMPWLFYGTMVRTKVPHVGYKAPDSFKWTNGIGEHVSSKFRGEFVDKYIAAVLDAFTPTLVDTIAVKGRYSATFPDGFDWSSERDYADAVAVARGECAIQVTRSVGESNHTSAELFLYAWVPNVGTVKVSVHDLPGAYRVAPIPVGIRRYGGDGPVSSVDRWDLPELAHRPEHTFRYGNGDHRRTALHVTYVFDSIAGAMTALKGKA